MELTESAGRAQPDDRGVRLVARRSGRSWLIALVNEDASAHMGVEVKGDRRAQRKADRATLRDRNGIGPRWRIYYAADAVGGKLFATGRAHESARRKGSEFAR